MKIAVFGANGYQGKLVAAELVRRGVEAVLVGRDPVRLARAAASVGLVHLEKRVATVDDHPGLVEALRGCDAVVNCAGPFTPSGEAVVRAAITAGLHYVDTAGEQLYISGIFATFAAAAEAAGVTVVPATTDACLPADLLAHLLAARIGPLDELTSIHVIVGGGGPSRGSLRSVIETIESVRAGGLAYDDGAWRPGVPARRDAVTLPGEPEATRVVRFPLPEVVTVPRHVAVRHVEGLAEAELVERLNSPVPAAVVESLPEGPSEDSRRGQRFTYVLDALGADGRRARGIVRGTDTYGTTAAIAAESACRLAAGPAKAGVLAPAQAFDSLDFLDYLARHGIRWSIEEPPAG
ncbi:saccharopine dehydrogenase family protein [Microbispora bryophytorum]|uniref:Saccharopine dehydrogenase NADP-binding domain-containing protein n=1 Tax=Microbispora bryophytorum subsp. camponoti TaxID=1677852 RepID=A0ABR8L9X4_9ACTN|nr:saccharopine dehydrogenase NADP-binding domain-containing protein [Microbispora camponoti]MBD3147041.1 saccharopine dehydrogenase NADP-binding domain-containing protein [Microbispora camponoti]